MHKIDINDCFLKTMSIYATLKLVLRNEQQDSFCKSRSEEICLATGERFINPGVFSSIQSSLSFAGRSIDISDHLKILEMTIYSALTFDNHAKDVAVNCIHEQINQMY